MNSKTIMLGVALVLPVLSAAACGTTKTVIVHSAASSSSPSVSSAPTATAAPSSSGYPQQAADEALCSAYQSASGDLQAMTQAVQQAGSSVSPVLANDIMYVVNNPGSVSQDEHNMIYVAMDCGEVAAGKPPVELNKAAGLRSLCAGTVFERSAASSFSEHCFPAIARRIDRNSLASWASSLQTRR